jgi:hypothetical protein
MADVAIPGDPASVVTADVPAPAKIERMKMSGEYSDQGRG